MRRLLAAAIALCLASSAAAAPSGGPHIKLGTPYATARKQLIRDGYLPARIIENGDTGCGGKDAPCPSEKLFCGGRTEYCEWLFVRRADETLFIVFTETALKGQNFVPDIYQGMTRASRSRLLHHDVVLITPKGRRRSFVNPPAEYQEPPTVMCAKTTPITQPCWLKPPAPNRHR